MIIFINENVFVFFFKTGKQRGAFSNTESEKLASTGLTEKQLQLSVEV